MSLMLVGVTRFGSVWRRRFGTNPSDPERFRQAAYFNTTGVCVSDRMVRHRKVVGHARFNGVGGFNPYYPQRSVGAVFECDEPSVWDGQNKVFFARRLDHPEPPDYYLVALRAAEFGAMNVGRADWTSDGVWLISFSEWRDEQEALLLVPLDGWVRTHLGRVRLCREVQRSWTSTLCLAE